MVAGRGGAWGSIAWGLAAVVAAGCLTRQHDDETTSSTGQIGTTDGGSTAGGTTMDPSIMTTTETPDSTATPSCDDGERNQGESDVDCGGPCSGCDEGQACGGDADCVSQACAAGECVAATCLGDADCADLATACTASTCGPDFTCVTAPDHEGEPCDDDLLCTTASACQSGACTATATLDCSNFDSACTAGSCDPDTGACVAADIADGTPCDDGDGCTLASACAGGVCQADGPGALFFEDFAGPADGWLRDTLWEVGPAATSPAGAGGADPGDDHSAGDDGRLAGAAIGELDDTTSHDAWCLTSPVVDTSMVAQSLWVSFWRHLHTPSQPLVIHTVEVWNGVAWKPLDTGYPAIVDDGEWTFVKYNATSHKAADFRLRICTERLAGAANFAGWSVDDVTIAAVACTP